METVCVRVPEDKLEALPMRGHVNSHVYIKCKNFALNVIVPSHFAVLGTINAISLHLLLRA